MKITIEAKTEAGTKAIQGHIESSAKVSWQKRQQLKHVGFIQEQISSDPLTLVVRSKPGSLFDSTLPDHAIAEIDKALIENGAEREKDYIIISEG